MKMLLLSMAMLAVVATGARPTIINIPDDYSTIQEGIDHGQQGDTVLVQPGRYHENLNFNGHNVVLASPFLTTQDTNYVLSTRLDGSRSGSVITFQNGENSTAQVIGFTIQNGLNGDWGGGIRCYEASPTISHNIIRSNYSHWHGGAISCRRNSSATIRNNTIKNNDGGSHGGAIFCAGSNPIVIYNVVTGNSADFGGGVYCYDYTPTIRNNTFSRNVASGAGGAIYCRGGNPVITNTILWGNRAGFGREIYVDYGGPIVRYSDVQGGWPGTGNIDADPLFVDPQAGDFHLQRDSPCIDAGDPSSPPDADGTRADMGALFFNHVVRVTITPRNPPIIIPPEGGTFRFRASVTNTGDTTVTVDVWTMADVPGIGYYGPLIRQLLSLSPHQTRSHGNVAQEVPGFAPPGPYSYIAYVGNYPEKMHSSAFGFIKSGKSSGGKWSVTQLFEEVPQLNLPVATWLAGNYPNPFNAETNISYTLAEAGNISLKVYDITGRLVATLVDERQEAGEHEVIWDGSALSSGIYFCKLQTSVFTDVKKMNLLK